MALYYFGDFQLLGAAMELFVMIFLCAGNCEDFQRDKVHDWYIATTLADCEGASLDQGMRFITTKTRMIDWMPVQSWPEDPVPHHVIYTVCRRLSVTDPYASAAPKTLISIDNTHYDFEVGCRGTPLPGQVCANFDNSSAHAIWVYPQRKSP